MCKKKENFMQMRNKVSMETDIENLENNFSEKEKKISH